MAKQLINLGTAPTGVGGDTPRSAFTKANANFDELYLRDSQLGTAANRNVGTALGQVLAVPAYGIGKREDVANTSVMSSMNVWETSFGAIADATQFRPLAYGVCMNLSFPGSGNLGAQLWMGTSPGKVIGFRSGDYANESFNTIYHTGNTTRAADGTLKAI